MKEAAAQKLVQYLYEAHATELMITQTLTAHIAMTPKGDYRDLLERHLRQTRDHARRIQELLARREQARGLMQVGYGLATGAVSQALSLGRLPVDLVRGMSGEEKLLKNARDESANEATEIAVYLAIEEVAAAVGDTEAANLARSIREDEERMLEQLQELIPRLASDVLRAEADGDSRFDLRRIGAVDAARTVAGSAARTLTRSATRAGRRASRAAEAPTGTPRSPSPTPLSEQRGSSTSSRSRKTSTSGSRSSAGSKRSTGSRSSGGSKAKS